MKLEGKPKQQIETLKSSLPVGKQVKVSFGKHPDVAVLTEIRLATLAWLKSINANPPAKYTDLEGKEYSRPTVSLIFDNGTVYRFHIPLDSIDLQLGIGGATLKLKNTEIVIYEYSGNNDSKGSGSPSKEVTRGD